VLYICTYTRAEATRKTQDLANTLLIYSEGIPQGANLNGRNVIRDCLRSILEKAKPNTGNGQEVMPNYKILGYRTHEEAASVLRLLDRVAKKDKLGGSVKEIEVTVPRTHTRQGKGQRRKQQK